MSVIGVVVISVVMCCTAAGAIASLRDPEKGLGREFLEGLHAIGHIFVPVAGIMASIPYLSRLVQSLIGPVFSAIGADPAIAATSVIAVDMGGYQLADRLAQTRASWIMAMLTGYMAGATIVFSVPVGLSLLDKRDHKYMALGVMSGLLSIPVGVLVASLLLLLLQPAVRPTVSTSGPASVALELAPATVLLNLAPLAAFVTVLALGLRRFPDAMIRGFMAFGRAMTVLITLVLAASIIEYFTRDPDSGKGLFSRLFGGWGFDPVIADADQIEAKVKAGLEVRAEDIVRALEVAGYIGLMLSGAFPMVYLIKKYLARPMEAAGRKLGLSAVGAAGLVASAANILAMFRLVRDMPAKDKVLNIAFAVCAAFLFGDHLAFTANFQPNLLLPVMAGKLAGGAFAFVLAYRLSVPKALELESQERIDEVKALAALVPELQGKDMTVTELGGGLTNRNCRVDAGGESYVVRIAGAGTELLGIDREREVACSHAAAGAGVGPAVVAHLPEHHALITRFIRGQQVKEADARRPDLLRRLAGALRRCHDYPAPPDLGAFSPFETVRRYHALAHERCVRLPPTLDRALALLGDVERQLATAEPPCLCHNDLLPGNFLDDGTTVWIIDWEYGGLGDRFFDLGNFAVNFQLHEEEERHFLDAYWSGEAPPEHLRRLRLMRLVSDLREAMWGFLQAGVSRLHSPGHYLAYGVKHLDRFLAAAERAMSSRSGGTG
jgi:ethanolamine transporter